MNRVVKSLIASLWKLLWCVYIPGLALASPCYLSNEGGHGIYTDFEVPPLAKILPAPIEDALEWFTRGVRHSVRLHIPELGKSLPADVTLIRLLPGVSTGMSLSPLLEEYGEILLWWDRYL